MNEHFERLLQRAEQLITRIESVLPQPLVSLMILALWIAIAPAPSLGQFVLGSAIAVAP